MLDECAVRAVRKIRRPKIHDGRLLITYSSSISLKKPSATADEQQLVMTEQIDGGPTAGIQVVDNISPGKVG